MNEPTGDDLDQRDALPPTSAGPGPGGLMASADQLGWTLAGRPDRDVRPGDQWRALARLGLGVAVLLTVAAVFHFLTTLGVVAAIVVFVMLHELGHLLTAKWTGMKVTEYFVGFGPTLWSIRRGETSYGVKAIPAGGYVRIIGMNNLEEVDPADEARSYREQSFPRRALVVSAGSLMHFLIALVLLFVVNVTVGVPADHGPVIVDDTVALTSGPSPAQRAGLRPGDQIVAIDGAPVRSFEALHAVIERSAGRTLHLDVHRGGTDLTVVATPVSLSDQVAPAPTAANPAPPPPPSGPNQAGFLGVVPRYPRETANPLVAVGRSAREFGTLVVGSVQSLGHLASPHGVGSFARQVFNGPSAAPSQDASNRPQSVVGIVRLTSQAASQGAVPFLGLLVLINVVFGVFNLLPLLPFDGGHVAIAVYERLRSRKGRRYRADVARLMPVTYAVVLVLVFLFVTTLYLDIVHPINLPK